MPRIRKPLASDAALDSRKLQTVFDASRAVQEVMDIWDSEPGTEMIPEWRSIPIFQTQFPV